MGIEGYLVLTKINELISRDNMEQFHDESSNSDIILYDGICIVLLYLSCQAAMEVNKSK